MVRTLHDEAMDTSRTEIESSEGITGGSGRLKETCQEDIRKTRQDESRTMQRMAG